MQKDKNWNLYPKNVEFGWAFQEAACEAEICIQVVYRSMSSGIAPVRKAGFGKGRR
jgi:hypothetical protein